MSFLNWFSRKPAGPVADAGESSGLGHADATQPIYNAAHPKLRTAVPTTGPHSQRRNERLERREMLYAIVRECMTQAGVLSSQYKFKVLSLDSRGREYLVMVDLPRDTPNEADHLAEIERLIARNAKSRHDIVVTAVYWRVAEQVTVDVPATPHTVHHAADATPTPRYEPLQADEVVAFKKALASAPAAQVPAPVGELVRSGRRNPAPLPVFAETEIGEGHPSLSGTQYGELR
jgi:hypothetical protein